ncbi:phage tail protein [Cronobacter dublinensis]|uniref:phage tail protein n=1 Tax=Cronobacter dublinensis TaxID=413497 RepID=UPI0024C224DC|nr:phage tail protein [Cronobacter dublinensis]MDK1199409.1 phage tail protein [Cronobacter dublinensis]
MADTPQKVIVQASRLDASILPKGISRAFEQYLLFQGADMKNIAEASNGANDLAFQATQKNETQDVILDNHELRIIGLRSDVDGHEARISANSSAISSLGSRVTTVEGNLSSLSGRVSTAEGKITSLQGDYVSKSATTSQTLASPINVATSYSVNGTKVVGDRQTGWTASTGSALLSAFNSSQAYSVSAAYTQAEVNAIATGLVQARQRIKALEDALRAHGLIN